MDDGETYSANWGLIAMMGGSTNVGNIQKYLASDCFNTASRTIRLVLAKAMARYLTYYVLYMSAGATVEWDKLFNCTLDELEDYTVYGKYVLGCSGRRAAAEEDEGEARGAPTARLERHNISARGSEAQKVT